MRTRMERSVSIVLVALAACSKPALHPLAEPDAQTAADAAPIPVVDAGGVLDASVEIGLDGPAVDTGPSDSGSIPDAGLFADAGHVDRDASIPDWGGGVDLDQDGIPDSVEDQMVHDYLPFLSVEANDSCPLGALLYRARPHPMDPSLVHVIVVHLYERDCGPGPHAGDDEVFGMTIDPSIRPPEGILAVRAIAHQNTPCQKITDCGRCSGATACSTGTRMGAPYPVVFSSKNKHGSYLSLSACDGACFITNFCDLAPTPDEPPILNAGEPGRPLTHDLTASGIVTSTAGWTETSLFHYDPWGGTDFGGAGNVAADLVDNSFLTPACTP